MQRRLPRIIRVRSANETLTTIRHSKITFTSAVHGGSKSSAENAIGACSATHVTNLSSVSSKEGNRCRHLLCCAS